MAFENLSNKLQEVFKQLRSKGVLTEADVKAAMREVKIALLEADVNFKIVKEFIKKVTERAVGTEVLQGLNPGQQVIKIVNEELIALMGSTQAQLTFSRKPPTVFMMVGLQGAGKTTTSGKLAGQLRKQGRSPLLVACDVYRPAAVEQLHVVGGKLDLPVYSEKGVTDAVGIAKRGLAHALAHSNDVLIIDTAGRLHIDEKLMNELKEISAEVNPTEILLVIDAMTGQDAVNVAETFNRELEISGVILTKLDGDTRGGAALSVRAVTQKPIKFCGMGEKLTDLEVFHPDRMASRILGMGDMITLIEKAEQALDLKKAEELERKMRSQRFTFTDFLDQMAQMKNMGSMQDIIKMLPGGNKIKDIDIDEKRLAHIEAIITSMTPRERELTDKLTPSRKERIAKGSGTSMTEVNALLKQFEQMQKMMKQLTGGLGGKQGKRRGKLFRGFGSFMK